MGARVIFFPEALEIKIALWRGERQESIATRYGVSQVTIHRISNGKAWTDVPYPDGSKGALSPERVRELKRERATQPTRGTRIEPLQSDPAGSILSEAARLEAEAFEIASQKLMAQVADIGVAAAMDAASKDEPITLPPYSEGEWLVLAKRAPKNKLIRLAAKDKSSPLRRLATQTVFNHIAEDRWGTPLAERLVEQTLTEFRKASS